MAMDGVALSQALCLLILGILLGSVHAVKEESWYCDKGWTNYTGPGGVFCMNYRTPVSSHASAQTDCVSLNASIVSIHSEEKNKFMLVLLKKSYKDGFWLGLKKDYGSSAQPYWLRKNGTEKLDYYPQGTLDVGEYSQCGVLRSWSKRWVMGDCQHSYTKHSYYCEKRPHCNPGTFGNRCEKECHCHGITCDVTGRCPYGCARGWMGEGCYKRKESADVTYYCIKSEDQGTYASIRIDTKGVNYRNIEALDSDGGPTAWCNDTQVTRGQPADFVHIHIPVDDVSMEELAAGRCAAGQLKDNHTVTWTVSLQERPLVAMDTDKVFSITCDFRQAETMSRDSNGGIDGKVRRPVEKIKETHEVVRLNIVDAFSGKPLTAAPKGSPVRLQMQFGVGIRSLVKGIVPYNCEATSSDGTQRLPILDGQGCRESPMVGPFTSSPSSSHIIQTEWFPLFGFEGSPEVLVTCSFIFCFVECDPGCSGGTQHRGRRSADDATTRRRSAVGWIEVLPADRAEVKPTLMTDLISKLPATHTTKWIEPEYADDTPLVTQWATFSVFFLLLTASVLILLAVYVTTLRALGTQTEALRREMTSLRGQKSP